MRASGEGEGPFYQQPVVESSLYGVVALRQYLYRR
jgi:hypothetical protein